ncbi:hypothetical protein VTJ49DRAFT_7565 [Mycothermus thermophilus]|uniref:Uncharacterized protein n=1 Tax=Humicola insolens TaxID=85995 RepID=A0ABR3VGH7_HUMIN
MSKVKTFLLAPNFTYHPGMFRLGDIIQDPTDPTLPLSRAPSADRLPASLRRLHLGTEHLSKRNPGLYSSEHEDETPEDDPTYNSLVKRALLQLAFESSVLLPHLTRVSMTGYASRWVGIEDWNIAPEFDERGDWTLDYFEDKRTVRFEMKR